MWMIRPTGEQSLKQASKRALPDGDASSDAYNKGARVARAPEEGGFNQAVKTARCYNPQIEKP